MPKNLEQLKSKYEKNPGKVIGSHKKDGEQNAFGESFAHIAKLFNSILKIIGYEKKKSDKDSE